MVTVYIAPSPTGLDSRTYAEAQVAATPWRTLQKAWEYFAQNAIADGVIMPATVGEVVWDGPNATLSTFPAGANLAPVRPVIRIPSGTNARFRIPTGTGVKVPGETHRGHLWMILNPDGLLIDVQPGATLTLEDYLPAGQSWPEEVNSKTPSAIYMGIRAGAAGPQSANNATIRGKLVIPSYFGNGVHFQDVQGCGIEPSTADDKADISGCMTGVRWTGASGRPAS